MSAMEEAERKQQIKHAVDGPFGRCHGKLKTALCWSGSQRKDTRCTKRAVIKAANGKHMCHQHDGAAFQVMRTLKQAALDLSFAKTACRLKEIHHNPEQHTALTIAEQHVVTAAKVWAKTFEPFIERGLGEGLAERERAEEKLRRSVYLLLDL